MPSNAELVNVQQQFYKQASFSRVIGCVDGTHIKIQSPGDSGYPLKSYLLTPLANTGTRTERLYNESYIRTRNCIEKLFGVWKRRFPVLAYGLRLKVSTVMSVILATAVLHNIARANSEPEPPPPENVNLNELNYLIAAGQIPDIPNVNSHNLNFRNTLVNDYFANL
ncbi:hypothetical protein HUJ05_009727 [Dendroctonus ponderosae]|nr:hypothetical protein HUJ05_009727 [Dendroctonus ponderosae]